MAPPLDLVRLSIGIEDVDDLVDDLVHAFMVLTDRARIKLKRIRPQKCVFKCAIIGPNPR